MFFKNVKLDGCVLTFDAMQIAGVTLVNIEQIEGNWAKCSVTFDNVEGFTLDLTYAYEEGKDDPELIPEWGDIQVSIRDWESEFIYSLTAYWKGEVIEYHEFFYEVLDVPEEEEFENDDSPLGYWEGSDSQYYRCPQCGAPDGCCDC